MTGHSGNFNESSASLTCNREVTVDYNTRGAERGRLTHATHASAITNASLHFPVCRSRNVGQSRILFVVRFR